MSLPITLHNQQVAVIATDDSLNGITFAKNGAFGFVDAIASGVTVAAVGDFVAFRKEDYAVELSYGNVTYYILDETRLLYTETPLP